jgi:hypothetical protein
MVKKTEAISIAIIVILALGVGLMGMQLYLPKTGYSVAPSPSPAAQSCGSAATSVSNSCSSPSGSTNSQNVFKGVITNANLAPQRLEGTATTDQGCGDAGNGLVNCVSDIVTSQGTLAFNYKHNMNIQPCLAMGGPEKVTVDILDSSGNAEVTRTQSSSGMMMH